MSRFFLLLPALGLAACSGTGGESASKSSASSTPMAAADPASKPFRMKTGDNGDDDYGKLADKFGSQSPNAVDKDGKPLGKYKSATYFDKANNQFNKGYGGKEYQAGEYKKKSFWGSKDYAKSVYGGNNDADGLRKPSRFQGDSAGEGSKVSRDGGRNFNTGNYNTEVSREMGKDRISKFSGEENARQSNMVSDAEVVPWQQQNGVTLQESKSRMGR